MDQIGEGKFGKVFKSCRYETFQRNNMNMKNINRDDVMACKIIQTQCKNQNY